MKLILKYLFSTKLLILILFFYSCKNEVKVVPTVPVEINIPKELILTSNKQTYEIIPDGKGFGILKYGPSQYEQISLSSRVYGHGLILYIPFLGEYYAYDRTCTFKAFEDYCALGILKDIEDVDIDNIAKCPCCESLFLLDNGLPITGSKATYRLKEYKVDVGLSTIRIYK